VAMAIKIIISFLINKIKRWWTRMVL